MTRTETIEATVHGTYHLAEPGGEPSLLVVGCHGYGETALHHLEAIRRIPGADRWLLCAVQALHPFYRKDGSVVASWMTSFDRDHALADNARYVASVVERLRERHPSIRKVAFTGFSQGVAMAYRAAAHAGGDALVALAGDVPPDVAESGLDGFPPVLIGRGDREQWYTEAKLQADVETLRTAGVPVQVAHFEGGHEWTDAFRTTAGRFLTETLGEG